MTAVLLVVGASQALADANYNTGMFFHQRPAPSVTSVSPTFGKNSTTITLTVTGIGILPGVKIMVGATQCTSVTVTNFTTATCTYVIPAGTGTNNVVITNANSTTATLSNAFTIYGTKQTFAYTGANQTFTVPAGVTSVGVKLWGPGGGGSGGTGLKNTGGAGGFVGGRLAVTPGDVLTVIVGGRGAWNSSAYSAGATTLWGMAAGGFGGGGKGYCAGDNSFCAGGGGGRSAVRNNAGTEVITAGGGGGGACSGQARKGGVGGDLTGGNAGGDANAATGGTQTQGGTPAVGMLPDGTQTPGQFQGGDGSYVPGSGAGGGGGGSGWYGGGGGNLQPGDFISGGGGSSYYNGAGVTWGYTRPGNNQTSGGSTEPDYPGGGIGSGGGITSNGGHGYAVILY